jgi:hypothetical protein
MARADVLRPYVEKTLKELLETDNLIIDEDGDVPIRWGSAMYYVRLLDREVPLVRLFATLVRGVKKNAKLLGLINQINTEIAMARVYWIENDVVVSTELVAETLDKIELDQACRNIGWIADTYDTKLKDEVGGEMSFADEKPDADPPVDV